IIRQPEPADEVARLLAVSDLGLDQRDLGDAAHVVLHGLAPVAVVLAPLLLAQLELGAGPVAAGDRLLGLARARRPLLGPQRGVGLEIDAPRRAAGAGIGDALLGARQRQPGLRAGSLARLVAAVGPALEARVQEDVLADLRRAVDRDVEQRDPAGAVALG